MLPGEWTLSMQRRVLGIPAGTREFQVVGFNKVYYDTLDSWTRGLAPTAAPGTTRISFSGILTLVMRFFQLLAPILMSMHYHWQRFSSSDASPTEFFFFEVGLLGPQDKSLRLKQSLDAAKIRAIAVWLSETLGVPIERRDRRSPD
jgi:hypothetical protein